MQINICITGVGAIYKYRCPVDVQSATSAAIFGELSLDSWNVATVIGCGWKDNNRPDVSWQKPRDGEVERPVSASRCDISAPPSYRKVATVRVIMWFTSTGVLEKKRCSLVDLRIFQRPILEFGSMDRWRGVFINLFKISHHFDLFKFKLLKMKT